MQGPFLVAQGSSEEGREKEWWEAAIQVPV